MKLLVVDGDNEHDVNYELHRLSLIFQVVNKMEKKLNKFSLWKAWKKFLSIIFHASERKKNFNS